MLAGTTAGAWGAATGLGQERSGNALRTTSQEAWPGAEPSGESPMVRAAVERRQADPLTGVPRPLARRIDPCACRRSASLFCFVAGLSHRPETSGRAASAHPEARSRRISRLLHRAALQLGPDRGCYPGYPWQSSGARASRERARSFAAATRGGDCRMIPPPLWGRGGWRVGTEISTPKKRSGNSSWILLLVPTPAPNPSPTLSTLPKSEISDLGVGRGTFITDWRG